MSSVSGGIVVFSGGSAANSLVDVFEVLRKKHHCSLSYIIPISDNGGSSSELIRVFGGPGIGDVRSRLVRLIPQKPYSREREAIGALLSHRLSATDLRDARASWSEVVDGTSPLWTSISSAKKELIRSIFNSLNLEILKRSRPPVSTFDFRSASIGNLFLTGARLFTGSFESAIYLLSAVCGISDEDVKVIPSINSNFSHHIAAELEDGSTIVGQNSISHPIKESSRANVVGGEAKPLDEPRREEHNSRSHPRSNGSIDDTDTNHDAEDANPPFTLLPLRANNIVFTKDEAELAELPSRISRIYYVNSFGQEILPPANPRAVQALAQAQHVIYSIGSLYTSIAPNLVLRGIGSALRRSHANSKILILNGSLDREVGPHLTSTPFNAKDFVDAIVRAGEQSQGHDWHASTHSGLSTPTISINNAQNAQRPVLHRANTDTKHFLNLGGFPAPMLASAMPSRNVSPTSSPARSGLADPSCVSHGSSSGHKSNCSTSIYKNYLTHLIHLPNSRETPFVDAHLLQTLCGIECREVDGVNSTGNSGMLYDMASLQATLGSIMMDNSSNNREQIRGRSGSLQR